MYVTKIPEPQLTLAENHCNLFMRRNLPIPIYLKEDPWSNIM